MARQRPDLLGRVEHEIDLPDIDRSPQRPEDRQRCRIDLAPVIEVPAKGRIKFFGQFDQPVGLGPADGGAEAASSSFAPGPRRDAQLDHPGGSGGRGAGRPGTDPPHPARRGADAGRRELLRDRQGGVAPVAGRHRGGIGCARPMPTCAPPANTTRSSRACANRRPDLRLGRQDKLR